MRTQRKVLAAAAVASAMALFACGGGDDGTGTNPPPAPNPGPTVLVGRMIDDPVQGVRYRTTSGASGLTGPNGEYNYVEGDRVSFLLGNQLLCFDIRATGILTPIAMAANNTILTNLLVLFQSLDQDGNPYNGISIPTAASETFVNEIGYMGQPSDVFASAANTQLVRAQKAAGITTGIVPIAQASAKFVKQFNTIFALSLWAAATTDEFFMFRSNPAGQYVVGQASVADESGMPGVESGTITAAGFDRYGWYVSPPTLAFDNNGEWGLSKFQACERVQVDGAALLVLDCQGKLNATFVKMENDPAGIIGAWAVGSATNLNVPVLLFFKNGKFGVIDPVGDTSPAKCGEPGVELGSYTYEPTARTLKISGLTYNTNGCAGLSATTAAGAGMTFTLSSDGATASFNDGTARTAYRVSQ